MSNPENGKVPYLNDNPPSYDSINPQQPPDANFPKRIYALTTIVTQPVSGNLQQTVVTRGPRQFVLAQTGMALNSFSESLICQYCEAHISTRVRFVKGNNTHLVALCFCLLGWWPCCLMLYCSDYCKNVEHTCPNCERSLGLTFRVFK